MLNAAVKKVETTRRYRPGDLAQLLSRILVLYGLIHGIRTIIVIDLT